MKQFLLRALVWVGIPLAAWLIINHFYPVEIPKRVRELSFTVIMGGLAITSMFEVIRLRKKLEEKK